MRLLSGTLRDPIRYRYDLKLLWQPRTQTLSMRKRSRHRLPLRQFSCCKHRWGERIPDEKPQSVCNKCNKMREAIPKGEEVGVCKFKCQCEKQCTVQCRMCTCDTAECYNCGKRDVKPLPDSITVQRDEAWLMESNLLVISLVVHSACI